MKNETKEAITKIRRLEFDRDCVFYRSDCSVETIVVVVLLCCWVPTF
jgi:hypothetical protein